MNKYTDYTKEELIKQIEKQEYVMNIQREQLRNNEIMKLPWIGNLGQWTWLLKENKVTFNDKKATALGYSLEEIPEEVGFEFFTSRLHPDDYDAVMENMQAHLSNKTSAYEVEYRIRTKAGNYIWYYDRGVVVKRDDKGQPLIITGIVFDISENKNKEEELRVQNKQLEELTRTDFMTGAFNRQYMLSSLNMEIKRESRMGSPLSIVMFDIDDFKSINDTYGHQVGDKVLIRIVQIIKERLRETDIICRWGGEEFLIALLDTDLKCARQVADEIRLTISEHKFEEVEKVTASFGVQKHQNDEKAEDLIHRADKNMYLAKKNGKNCIV